MEATEKKEDTEQRPPEITMTYVKFILVILWTVILTTVYLGISTIITAKIVLGW